MKRWFIRPELDKGVRRLSSASEFVLVAEADPVLSAVEGSQGSRMSRLALGAVEGSQVKVLSAVEGYAQSILSAVEG